MSTIVQSQFYSFKYKPKQCLIWNILRCVSYVGYKTSWKTVNRCAKSVFNWCKCKPKQFLNVSFRIFCAPSYILSKNLLETEDPVNKSAKSVCHKFKPSQWLHLKYSVLSLTYSLENFNTSEFSHAIKYCNSFFNTVEFFSMITTTLKIT